MGHDKVQHFIAGFFLSLIGFFWMPLISLGFIYGLGKEVWDLHGNGTPDIWDMFATWAGASVAILLLLNI